MIDIVIVNWNAGTFLADCLDSITENGAGLVGSTMVVDNGSTDGSELAAEGREGVKLARTGENLGFGKGCNLGAAQGTGDLILFLNPDAKLLPHGLEPAVNFMRSGKAANVGICGGQLIDEHGHVAKSSSRFPSPWNLFCRSTGLDRINSRWNARMNEWDHQSSRNVDQVMGAFFLVRRDLFEQLGGFDERFFVYYEEVDLSKRAADAGWASWYEADAKAFHYGGGSSQNVKATRLFYSLRSRLKYARKHFGPGGSFLVAAATLALEPLTRSLQALVRGRFSEIREVLSGYGMLFTSIEKEGLSNDSGTGVTKDNRSATRSIGD